MYAAFRGIVGIEIHGSKWSGAVSVLALLVGVLFISSRGGVYPIPCLQASCPASVVTSGDILAPISVYPPLEGFQLTANFLSILLPVAALPIGMTLHPVQVYGAWSVMNIVDDGSCSLVSFWNKPTPVLLRIASDRTAESSPIEPLFIWLLLFFFNFFFFFYFGPHGLVSSLDSPKITQRVRVCKSTWYIPQTCVIDEYAPCSRRVAIDNELLVQPVEWAFWWIQTIRLYRVKQWCKKTLYPPVHPVPDGAVKEGCKGFLFFFGFVFVGWRLAVQRRIKKTKKKKKKKLFARLSSFPSQHHHRHIGHHHHHHLSSPLPVRPRQHKHAPFANSGLSGARPHIHLYHLLPQWLMKKTPCYRLTPLIPTLPPPTWTCRNSTTNSPSRATRATQSPTRYNCTCRRLLTSSSSTSNTVFSRRQRSPTWTTPRQRLTTIITCPTRPRRFPCTRSIPTLPRASTFPARLATSRSRRCSRAPPRASSWIRRWRNTRQQTRPPQPIRPPQLRYQTRAAQTLVTQTTIIIMPLLPRPRPPLPPRRTRPLGTCPLRRRRCQSTARAPRRTSGAAQAQSAQSRKCCWKAPFPPTRRLTTPFHHPGLVPRLVCSACRCPRSPCRSQARLAPWCPTRRRRYRFRFPSHHWPWPLPSTLMWWSRTRSPGRKRSPSTHPSKTRLSWQWKRMDCHGRTLARQHSVVTISLRATGTRYWSVSRAVAPWCGTRRIRTRLNACLKTASAPSGTLLLTSFRVSAVKRPHPWLANARWRTCLSRTPLCLVSC